LVAAAAALPKPPCIRIIQVPPLLLLPCSKSHAPGFIQHAADLKAKGVDTIACVSVNDAFVMDAWAKDLAAGALTHINHCCDSAIQHI
jgi:peroxiredoxin